MTLDAQHGVAFVRACKKAWSEADPGVTEFAVYLLAAADDTESSILAYDYGEFAAFIGGVGDGEFVPEPGVAITDSVPRSPIDWSAVHLPAHVDEAALIAEFAGVRPQLHWLRFGERGPAWARCTVHGAPGHVSVESTPYLSLDEMRRIAQLPA